MLPEIILGHILGFKAEEDGDIKKKKKQLFYIYGESFIYSVLLPLYVWPQDKKTIYSKLKGPPLADGKICAMISCQVSTKCGDIQFLFYEKQ